VPSMKRAVRQHTEQPRFASALANPHGSVSASISPGSIELDPGLLYDLRPFWKLLSNHRGKLLR
jgi:hypothetical protein